MNLIYKSRRVGLNGKEFDLLKFRTMHPSKDGGSPTASVDDDRLTPIGKWLRRFKLDELPTLWNVLRGDIVIVGPRPDVPSELASLDYKTYESVVSVKPGLLSPATLWNINEDVILKDSEDPHADYCKKIKPIKYRLNVWYVQNRSWWLDLKVVVATLFRFAGIKIRIYPKELEL